MLQSLPIDKLQKVQERAKELKAEEIAMSLPELRKALSFTQEDIANILEIGQASVSRTEKRKDQLVSTLREYVEAMGGELKLIVDFPDRPPIKLAEIEIVEGAKNKSIKKPKHKRSNSKLSACV
jgi:transcriptional regulator with XRE-family HTH domain